MVVQSCCYDCYTNAVSQIVIKTMTPNKFAFHIASCILQFGGDSLQFQSCSFVIAMSIRNEKQHFFCSVNRIIIQQRTCYSLLDSFLGSIFSIGCTATDNCSSTIFQNSFHIAKINIHYRFQGDNFCNTFGRYQQNIICFGKKLAHFHLRIKCQQRFIFYHQQCVNIFFQFVDTFLCNCMFLLLLEAKRESYNADSQDIHFTSNTGNNRRCSRTGATAHTGGYKHHVCSFQCSFYLIFTL